MKELLFARSEDELHTALAGLYMYVNEFHDGSVSREMARTAQ